MTMKTFTSGWMFQKPDQNYFKKFLRLNGIAIDGIVYRKKILENIEGIPVLDFETARDVIGPDDTVLELSARSEVREELETFFAEQGVKLVPVARYLDRLITGDAHDALVLPVAGIKSSDIRHLKSVPAPGPFDAHFLDAASYDVASKLDGIFRASEWQRLVDFDRDDTHGNVLFNVLLDLQARDLLKHLRVLDTPRPFFDAILKLKLHHPKAAFTVSVSAQAWGDLGGRAEFYRRSLTGCLVPFDGAAGDPQAILMSGAADALVAAGPDMSAICCMPRSIVDYVAVKEALGETQYRMLLRQPDTMAQHLIAAILTPALFGL